MFRSLYIPMAVLLQTPISKSCTKNTFVQLFAFPYCTALRLLSPTCGEKWLSG